MVVRTKHLRVKNVPKPILGRQTAVQSNAIIM
jgi:hypothetical protein